MRKKVIISITVILVVGFMIYQGLFKEEASVYESVKAVKGIVVQEITETGQVAKGEKVNLSYKSGGKVEGIYVEVGQEVQKGMILAKLDTGTLAIQVKEAESSLSLYQAELEKLLAGPTQLEMQKAETTVANARALLGNAKTALESKKQQAEESISSAYEDALNVLLDAYLKSYNSWNAADGIKKEYFTQNDQQGIRVAEETENILFSISEMESSIESAENSSYRSEIDQALVKTATELSQIYSSLAEIRAICDETNYKDSVSSTDKSLLDTHKGNINTALTSVVNSRQAIASANLTNAYNISQAEYSVTSAEGSLELAKGELSILTADPRQEDVALYQSQVQKAQAQVSLLERQIQESYLVSPVHGEVAQIQKRVGENIVASELFVVVLPSVAFEVDLDLYEEDVVRVSPGNEVEISLVAFPDQTYKGTVSAVDPAEKIKDGIVYYEAKISFEEAPEGIKPGMTADVVIKTDFRENVLIIPEDALIEKDSGFSVEILENGIASERVIEIGLVGTNDMVEVLSGLSEGEKVVLQ